MFTYVTSCLWCPWLGCISSFPDGNLVVGTSDMLVQCFLARWKLTEIYVTTQVDVSIHTNTFLFQDCSLSCNHTAKPSLCNTFHTLTILVHLSIGSRLPMYLQVWRIFLGRLLILKLFDRSNSFLRTARTSLSWWMSGVLILLHHSL